MNIDLGYLREQLINLVSIPSTNPSLSPDGSGEGQITAYVASELQKLGLSVQVIEPQAGRTSVVGWLKGSGGGRSLMWNGHSDTVGVTGMADPFMPNIKNGRLYGRGAQDMKGSLAAMLAAMKELVEGGVHLSGDVLLAAVADEEFGSLGTTSLFEYLRIDNHRIDGAIVTEPTDLRVAAAHRGYVWLEVETSGKAAHGSRWWEGRDANRLMGRVLNALDGLADELVKRKPHPLVGPPSLHTPIIQGGSEMSIYAARCMLQIERRTVPGETPQGVVKEIQALLDELAVSDAEFKGTVKAWFDRPPFEAKPDSLLLPILLSQSSLVLEEEYPATGVAFWTDAALLAEAGIDTLLIGPQGDGLHTTQEWVELESCAKLAEILVNTARIYCA